MEHVNYREVVEQTIKELHALIDRSYELDAEIARKQQFLNAAMNMLNEEERDEYYDEIRSFEMRDWGLTDAIKEILQSLHGWTTATQMRDLLRSRGFDFSRYKTNPLASVHSVMRRLTDVWAETAEVEGVTAWRWKGIRRAVRKKK